MRIYPNLTVDGEFQALRALGYTGSMGDMQLAFFRAAGYTGTLSDGFGYLAGGAPPVVDTSFKMTVATTSPSEVFTLPSQNTGVFNAEVDWGDGSSDTITTYNDAARAHTYTSSGNHQITITGDFPNISFNNLGDKLKVISVDNFGDMGWETFLGAFYGCTNMTTFTVSSAVDTSLVTTMINMFRGCSSLTTVDLSDFDVSSVTNMSLTFRDCSSLTSLGLSGFTTTSALNTSNMFRGCSSLTALDVSSFDTSSVSNMSNMFRDCSSTSDIVGVDDFDIGGLNSSADLTAIMQNVTLPTSRYDSLLINWETQDPFNGMSPNFGSSTYTLGGAAATARASLVSRDGWTITDGGGV